MLRNTSVSLSEPTAALATTKATVALSVLSFAAVRLTQNCRARHLSLLSSSDEVHGMLGLHELVAGQPAPCRQVRRRAPDRGP